MSKRRFKEIVRDFSKKGLANIMEAQVGKTVVASVPMSPRCVRSSRKKVVTEE